MILKGKVSNSIVRFLKMKKSHIIFIAVLAFLQLSCAEHTCNAKRNLLQLEFKFVADASDPKNLVFEDKAVIDNEDIADAYCILNGNRRFIVIRMTPEGSKKFKSVTEKNLGKQIAILLDDKILSAPVVQEPITNGAVQIALPEDITKKQASVLVAGILNKPVPDFDDTINPNIQDSEPPQYYTEEEYLAIKKQREAIGLYNLDRNYSKEELNSLLKKGMDEDTVLKLLGKPSSKFKSDKGGNLQYIYSVAAERQPINYDVHPDGFSIIFINKKVFRWAINYSNITRRRKPQYKEKSKLKLIMPKVDVSSEDFNFGAYLESISIPDTKQKLNRRDGFSLLSVVLHTPPETKINGNCDFLQLLESNFPEMAQLKWENNDSKQRGNIKIKELQKLLRPYSVGKRKLPGWD